MIAAIYVAVALAFWTPRNHNVPPCGGLGGVKVEWASTTAAGQPSHRAGYAVLGSCTIHLVKPEWDALRTLYAKTLHPTQWVRRVRCAIVVHELGHAGLSLDHSSNPHSIMNGDRLNIPAVCKIF